MSEFKKNTASQVIGFSVVDATDGSAKTSGVSITITKDGGTQTASAGTLTHEGNGHYTYAFTQGETDADHVYIGWHGTDVIPGGLNLYTTTKRISELKDFDRATETVTLADGGITDAKIASGAITSAKFGSGAITSTVMASNAIGASQIASDAITDAKIASGALTSAKFASGAFDAVWSVGTRTLTAFDAGFKTGYALSSAGVQAIWDALTSALTTAGSIGKLIVDNLNATVSSRAPESGGNIAAIKAKTDNLPASPAATGDIPASDITAIKAKTDNLPADPAAQSDITALNDLSAAQVNAEVVDALSVDTYAEPGQGAPSATASLKDKLGYLYKSWRNKKTNDGSETILFADNGSTADQKQATSETGGTVEKGKWGTGA
jgi:hypothetical protein